MRVQFLLRSNSTLIVSDRGCPIGSSQQIQVFSLRKGNWLDHERYRRPIRQRCRQNQTTASDDHVSAGKVGFTWTRIGSRIKIRDSCVTSILVICVIVYGILNKQKSGRLIVR